MSFLVQKFKREGVAMSYYICVLTTGEMLDFNNKGEGVEWSDDMFRVRDKAGMVIAIIPRLNVSYFLKTTK